MAMALLPLYLKRQGFEDWEIGWLAAGFSFSAIVARTKLGDWLEDWGRRPFLILGALLLAVLPGTYHLLGNQFLPWVLVRLVQGAGLAFYITSILTWVADRSPVDKIAAQQGVFGVSGLLGAAVGPIAAEAVYQTAGFAAMFQAIGATGLLAVLLSASLPETRSRTEGEPLRAARLNFSEHRATLCVTIPFGWFVGTVIAFIAPYCDSVGIDKVGLYFAGFALASVTVRLVSGSFIDKVRINRLVGLNGGMLVLSGLTLACLNNYPLLALLFGAALLNGIGHGFLFPGLSAHTVRKTSPKQRGAGIALFTGTFDAGILLGSVASGYISQQFGYSGAFLTASLLLLASLPLFAKLNDLDFGVNPELLQPVPELKRTQIG